MSLQHVCVGQRVTLKQKHKQNSHAQLDREEIQVDRAHSIDSQLEGKRATQQLGQTYIIYKTKLLALMRKPMSAYEKLAILLPCKMGFRATEVGTWRAEYIDYTNESCLVLDAKKHQLFSVLLSRECGKLAEQVLNGRTEGPVLYGRSRSKKYEGLPISGMAVWHIWQKHTDLSPLDGRRGFAALWYYTQRKSIPTLQRQMRHLVRVPRLIIAARCQLQHSLHAVVPQLGRESALRFTSLAGRLDLIQIAPLQNHLRERFRQSVFMYSSGGAFHIVGHSQVAYTEQLPANVQDGIASARVAVVGPPHAAGIDEPGIGHFAPERLMRMSANDHVGARQLRQLAQSFDRCGGREVFLN